MRRQCTRNGLACAHGCVHVVEELGGEGRVEGGCLARIDDRAATDGDVPVEPTFACKACRVEEGGISGLDVDSVEQGDVDRRSAKRGARSLHVRERADARVGEEPDAFAAERPRRFADLVERAMAEDDPRSIDRKRSLICERMSARHAGEDRIS